MKLMLDCCLFGLYHECVAKEENNIKQTVSLKMCNSCGACVAICPFGAIKKDNNNIPKISNELCIHCGICKNVCSGANFDFLNVYEKFHSSNKSSQNQDSQKQDDRKFNIFSSLGEFNNAYLAYANDNTLREKGTSGGFVKTFLISLLEAKKISGVVLISQDDKECFKGKGILAKTREDIINSGKSRYSRSVTLEAIRELENESGKFAVVALPCQIHSLWKIRKFNPKIDEKILFTIGLFCHSQVEVEAERIIFNKFKLNKLNIKEYISRFGKHPGTPYIRLDDDTLRPVYFPKKKFYRPTSHEILNVMYHLFMPKRCMYCFDGASELADISVGDPWIKDKKFKKEYNINFNDGYSFVLSRSNVADSLIEFAKNSNDITFVELPREMALKCNKKMIQAKKLRAWYFINKEGLVDYGKYKELIPSLSKKQMLKVRLFNISHMFCFYPSVRKFLLKVVLSNFGYIILYINHLRRKFKK